MVKMNMRWEALMLDHELADHPWPLVKQHVLDAQSELRAWAQSAYIADPEGEEVGVERPAMEERHHDLFQALWQNFDAAEYEDRIARYTHRLEINGIGADLLSGKRGIDFGCGHGNFAHALLRGGAAYVLGIDYGQESIRYAEAARDRLGVGSERLAFRVESVYEVAEPDESFDFALQNGVFHHLDDEDRAYREAHRVLKPGGWFWAYTDGEGGVSYDLWDAAVHVLRDVPPAFVMECVDFLGVETGKRYHLGDGLNATYRHTSWEEITTRLEGLGFGEFRRLDGGFPTDFDPGVIDADPFGREKYGEGDIRLLARKLPTS